MPELGGLPLGTILNGVGSVGLIVLFGIALGIGRLYTRGQVDEIRKAHDAEMKRMVDAHARELADVQHDRGEWRAESRIKDQTITEQSGQITALVDGFGVVKDFLNSLRRLGVGAVESGDRE